MHAGAFADLHHARRRLEEAFERLKHRQHLEVASGLTQLALVVGVPRNMDGSYGPSAERSRALIAELRATGDLEIVPWDERLTTVAAQRALRESGRKAKHQKGVIDQAAAQIILQSWLDSRP